MNAAIQSLQASRGLLDVQTPKPEAGGEEGFGRMLLDALGEVNGAQSESKSLQQDFLSGRKEVDLHDVMIAQEKASTAMQLTMAVRNKALEAFQEINRMPV